MTDAESPFETRLRACRQRLADRGFDGVVLFPSPNLYYVSGFREEPSERHLFLIVSRDDAAFVAPAMYDDQIRAASPIEDCRTWQDGEDPMAVVSDIVADFGLADGTVLLDDRLWAQFTLDVQSAFPSLSFGLASEVFDELRMRKDEYELGRLRDAARLSDRVSEAIRQLGPDAIGMTERDLAIEIRRRLVAEGADDVSFETIVGSGPNGAQPHYRHGDREIERGDPVVLDFGGVVDGYSGDQTRTVVFAGEPPAGFEEAYEAVLAAFEAGVDAVEPGVQAQAVDRAARGVLEERGFDDQFLHRTGHGIGLEVHEAPYIVEGNETELAPGMAFSVEPGVYVADEFGVRIEDIVVVTEAGCERLNDSSKSWRTR
ncbi:aminopeptidase P family protein [halophilic archaeon]|nr:aminopeptidase P family protein [halophilic archaeon]